MAIETNCSGCGQRLAVGDENAGKRARCPACGQIYTIPHPETFSTSLNNYGAFDADMAAPSAALAETSAGTDSDVASPNPFGESQPASSEFWMQTADGNAYGPVDRANLNRWFGEGRVGPGYQIRQDAGPWQPAEFFNPQSTPGSANPYAVHAAPTATYPSLRNYQKPDPSAVVLTMGILAWVCLVLCWPISWIPALIAWISGRQSLRDIQAGVADPTNVSLVQVGYYLGMIHVIVTSLIALGVLSFFAIALVAS